MTKEQQTPAIKELLYQLTFKFTRKLQPEVYKQYRGDVDDLASEFYCQFLTPKAREGEKETLLDKYDPSKKPASLTEGAFFANLVKVSVRRMLIDRSRSDQVPTSSLDSFIESFGESIYKTFDLTALESSNIDELDIMSLRPTLLAKVQHLSKSQLTALKSYYSEVKSVLSPVFRKVFDSVLSPILTIDTTSGPLPLYQVTPKTVCLLVDGAVVDFDRFTGASRKQSGVRLSVSGLSKVSTFKTYRFECARVEFPSVVSQAALV